MKDNSPGTVAPVLIIVGAVIAALILICGVLAVAFLFLGVSWLVPVSSTGSGAPTPQVEFGPDVKPLATPTPVGGSQGSQEQEPTATVQPSDVDTDLAMQAVEVVVADLRGLDAQAEVPKAYLAPDDLRDVVVNDFFEDYTPEDAADDAIFYAALDVVDLDFDLYQFYVDLYSEGIAGYYDPEKDEFFLIGDSNAFTANDEWTFAHEYIHALQDQHFDLVEFLHYDDDDWYLDNFDAALARSALIEGDASLGSAIYISDGMTPERQQALFEEYADIEIPEIYDRAPYFILQDFFFPYDQGQSFVDFLHTRGGFDRVNDAYDNPPASTEQILHPQRYIDGDEPIVVTLQDTLAVLGGSYREVYTLPMGEWYLQNYLSQLVDIETAQAAADGWGGDRAGFYFNDDTQELVMVVHSQWDNPNEATEFLTLFPQYGNAWSNSGSSAFSDAGLTCWQADDFLCTFRVGGTETLLIRGPDEATVRAIADSYR